MALEIVTRNLPGIGVCHELSVRSGRRIGVVARRNGTLDLIVYDEEGDGAELDVELTGDEADALAELLGGPTIIARLMSQQSAADELLTEQLVLRADSPFVGRPLGDTRARTRSGAYIVAVLRDGATHPSPGPDFVFASGDVLIVVGTRAGVDMVARILDGTR